MPKSLAVNRIMGRGAFIVFEGLDRAGKSTQVSMLTDALRARGVAVQKQSFPDRSTAIGKLIDDYLTKKVEFSPEAAHLLFSANRWECKDRLIKSLEEGTTLVVDRYAASGAAYAAANSGQTLEWCSQPDRGLPAPDLVVFLRVAEEEQQKRANWGEERFERVETQRKIGKNFDRLADPRTWFGVDAQRDKAAIHAEILERVLKAIQECADQSVKALAHFDSD
ncbi:thymidylate kinase [Trichogramma pretiosum]|uniref:thymidylate kinase n=1 Tax=Trichogramma pretiosum TaxID=7493 RepID=UPI0006C9682A|nr:thymidylate kinase [Trichogramma pretiosum]